VRSARALASATTGFVRRSRRAISLGRPAKALEPLKMLGAVPVLRLADDASRIDPGETGERADDAFPDDPDLLGPVVSERRQHVALIALTHEPHIMTMVEPFAATKIYAERRGVLQPDPPPTEVLEHTNLPAKSLLQ
jgi:hypothetical protein